MQLESHEARGNKKEPSGGGLSAMAYASISLVGLFLGIGLLVFYVKEVPELVQSGVQYQVFYLLLIPWALASAAFLFGAMRSYARFTHKSIGNVLELGGPVVLFCLVIFGGFRLVPAPPSVFVLTVRAESATDIGSLIRTGKVIADFGDDRREAPFNGRGEADFKGIPQSFFGKPVRFLPQVEGYVEGWQSQTISGDAITLLLQPTPASTRTLRIPVVDRRGHPIVGAVVRCEELPQSLTDSTGMIVLNVTWRDGTEHIIHIIKNSQEFSVPIVMPGPDRIVFQP